DLQARSPDGIGASRRAREGLEGQPQADRHNPRGSRPDKKLRLAKGATVQVGIDAVKIWMVGEVLGVRAKAKVHCFRHPEGLMNTEVQSDKSRPVEDISPQTTKPFVWRSSSWIGWIAEKRVWRPR